MRFSEDRARRMGAESIPKLLVEFSLPVMMGMIVQALYNVINRIFIGNAPEAATLGIAAITLGMPIVLGSMAFGGLVGLGLTLAGLAFFLREMRGLGRGADSLEARVVRSSRP